MSSILSIITIMIIITTVNSIITIMQIRSVERERVKNGYSPFSNFDYYYPMASWLVSTLVLLSLLFVVGRVPEPTNIWWLLLACIIATAIHFLAGIISSGVLSIIQARKVKQSNQEQLNQ